MSMLVGTAYKFLSELFSERKQGKKKFGKEKNTRPKYLTSSTYQNREQTKHPKVLVTSIMLHL